MIAALALAAACSSSPPVRRYTLLAPAEATPVAVPALRVRLDAVTLPEAVSRAQIVQRTGPHRLTMLDFDRWAEPLDAAAARVIGQRLAMRLAGAALRLPGDALPDTAAATRSGAGGGAAPAAEDLPEVRVAVDVTRFEQVPGRGAQVAARWTVQAPGGGVHEGRSVVDEPAGGAVEDLVAAQARALQRVADDIAAALGPVDGMAR